MTWNRKTAGLRLSLKGRDDTFLMSLEHFRDWLIEQSKTGSRADPENCSWQCVYCGNFIRFLQLSPDHALPLALGGTSADGNLVIACQPCNARKGMLGADQFRQLRATVELWPKEMRAHFWQRYGQSPVWR